MVSGSSTWANQTRVDLALDLDALGIEEPSRAWAPAVDELQEATDVDLAAVAVPAGQGVFLRLQGANVSGQ